MSYFVLENPIGSKKKLATFKRYRGFKESWLTGARFEIAPPNPIELIWDPEKETGERVSFYRLSIPLMKTVLVNTLRDAGVDNIDTYPVVIHSENGNPDCYDYVAVNIIGLISAVDMSASDIMDIGFGNGLGDVTFNSLVIDEKKTLGQLFFRLKEKFSLTLIHSKVVEHLNKTSIDFGLTFIKTEDYAG